MHRGAPGLTTIQMQEALADTEKLLSKESHRPSRMLFEITQEEAGEMAQWVKALASKLRFKFGTHSVEREK